MRKNGEYVLLNSDDHTAIIVKMGNNPADYRPDILHQSILTLFDSPLAKAGRFELLIHTSSNVLIKVSPELRVPRTFKRFAGLITQLLHTRKIKASEGKKVLMKVVKNPVTAHLPPGAFKVGTSVNGKLVKVWEYVREKRMKFVSLDENEPSTCPVFVIGMTAHQDTAKEIDYCDELVAISAYHLSAASCVGRIASAFENLWDIN
jgi:rRNA small subunit pseudouridine methyltransferase Nep1